MPSSLFQQQEKPSLKDVVMDMVKGKDPKQVFYDECRKRNADPDRILGIAKMLGR